MSGPGKKSQKELSTQSSTDQELSNLEITPSQYSFDNELHDYLERESMGYDVYPGTERVIYDFSAERLNMNNTYLIESTAYMIKGALGAGVLSMHVGYMYGGLWTSVAATVAIGPVVSYCMMMLVKSAQKMYVELRVSKLTYPDLAEVAVATGPWKSFRKYSKVFRYIVDICLFINLCGTCCIYEIMMAVTLKQAMESVFPTVKDINLTLRCYILIVTVPLALVCVVRNLKYLAPLAWAAEFFIAVCVLIAMCFSIEEASSIQERPAWKSVHGFLRFTGICLFSINGAGITLAVENNMRKPKYFSIVMQYGMVVVLICVFIIGFFGYWAWGEECRGPITIHMQTTTVFTILQFLLVAMFGVSFAVHLWVPFRLAWRYIIWRHKRKRGIWERFYKIAHVTLITCMSIAFPNMIKLMIFIGNFFLAWVTFIFPAFIESLVKWKEPCRGTRLIKNSALILIGIMLCGAAFYSVLDV